MSQTAVLDVLNPNQQRRRSRRRSLPLSSRGRRRGFSAVGSDQLKTSDPNNALLAQTPGGPLVSYLGRLARCSRYFEYENKLRARPPWYKPFSLTPYYNPPPTGTKKAGIAGFASPNHHLTVVANQPNLNSPYYYFLSLFTPTTSRHTRNDNSRHCASLV